MTKEDTLGPFAFTDDQWRTYQQIPHQGYSHRHHLEHVFNSWLASRLTREKIAEVIHRSAYKILDIEDLTDENYLELFDQADAILALLTDTP